MLRTSGSICTSLLVGFVLLFGASPAHAQGLGGFAFTAFSSEMTVHEDSSFDVVERIEGEYFEPRHGLYRQIPVSYTNPDGTSFSIGIRIDGVTHNGEPTPYDVYHEGPYQVIKIGDADVYVNGPFVYEIAYHVERAILYHEEHDELYWNVTGDQWGTTIPSVSTVVHLPGAAAGAIETTCYTGAFGSTVQDCEVNVDGATTSVTATDFLTVSVLFSKGVVVEPDQMTLILWWLRDNWDFALLLLPLVTALALWRIWAASGKDPEGRGTIMAEYEPIDGLRPTEIGTLVDGNFHPQDLSAAIIDLAVRGYIHIAEEENGVWMFKNKTYTLKKMKEADAELKPFEKELLNGLFGDQTEVSLESRRTELVATKKKVAKLVYQDMASLGYFVSDPNKVRGKFIGIAIVVGFVGHFVGSTIAAATERPVAILAFILTAIVIGVFGTVMPKRTEKGVMAYEHAKGFKLYLSMAEQHRIQWQEKENIFEKFLPYAMVFGVADKWAKVFADIQKEPPRWYSGNMAAFTAMDFSNQVTAFGATAAKVATPQSNGSGGGGSSGGGFGGGGGGSW